MQIKTIGIMLLQTTRRWVSAALLAVLAFMVLFAALLSLLAWKSGAFEPGWHVDQIPSEAIELDIGSRAE